MHMNTCILLAPICMYLYIEHRNDKPHVFCVTIIWWPLEADDLIYVADHAERHDLTPVITFDQPLWWKSLAMQLSQPEGSPI